MSGAWYAHTIRLLAALAAIVATSIGAVAQTRSAAMIQVQLPYGISLRIPRTWRCDNAQASSLISQGHDPADLTFLAPDITEHLISFASPRGAAGEASVEITISDTNITQQRVADLSDFEVKAMGENDRRQYTSTAAANGYQIVSWYGTTRERIGGILMLVSRYEYRERKPGRPTLYIESYRGFRGPHSVFVRFQHTLDSPEITKALAQIKSSFHIVR